MSLKSWVEEVASETDTAKGEDTTFTIILQTTRREMNNDATAESGLKYRE